MEEIMTSTTLMTKITLIVILTVGAGLAVYLQQTPTLPDTADAFNDAANRLDLTEILLTSPEEYKQYNDKFWCYHKKNNTDVWEKGRAICKGETATSPNCNAVIGGTALCGIVHKPSKNNVQYRFDE